MRLSAHENPSRELACIIDDLPTGASS